MKAIGRLKIISGIPSVNEATLYKDRSGYVLYYRAFLRYKKIDLNNQIISCFVDTHTKTSTPSLLLKMGLGGLAGHAWGKGHRGTSGVLVVAASSLKTNKNIVLITLNLCGGEQIQAETNGRTAAIIKNIVPQLSSRDIKNAHIREKEYEILRQKSQRFLEGLTPDFK